MTITGNEPASIADLALALGNDGGGVSPGTSRRPSLT